MRSLHIRSSAGIYSVTVDGDLRLLRHSLYTSGPYHILVDADIRRIYPKLLKGFHALSVIPFSASEANKTMRGAESVIRSLLTNNIQKHHTLVVIGGGTVQDVGTFAAHILFRGMRWIYVPTTLLSMADSCIGAKSAINVGGFKNQIGVFHEPAAVYINPVFLTSLPVKEIQNGIGEILKFAILTGRTPYRTLIRDIPHIPGDRTKTERVIMTALGIKKRYIEEDEFDRGIRRKLNYGHTFGHALEGYMKHAVPHGIAVTIGMDMANYISMKRGFLPEAEFHKLSRILHGFIPYNALPLKDVSAYLRFLARDKKASGTSLTVLACRGIGSVDIVSMKLDNSLKSDISGYIGAYATLHAARTTL